jgi:putative intracellular protease/amidase
VKEILKEQESRKGLIAAICAGEVLPWLGRAQRRLV